MVNAINGKPHTIVWGLLRVKHEDSIKLSLEIPIVFANSRKGAKHIFIDHEHLPYYLDLHQSDMIALRETGLIQPEAPVKIPKLRIDYTALAQEYRQKLKASVLSRKSFDYCSLKELPISHGNRQFDDITCSMIF